MAGESMKYCADVTRDATTHLVVLERGICYGYPATKVLLRPITGRRHQLRIHTTSLGHTIVGDYTYSNRKDVLPYRMFLHAYKLQLLSRLENLDITTEDPFTSSNPRNKWESHESVLTIPDALYELSLKS
jgi:23S rRNA-/tRNA-specific pseudouridylate synthase